MCVLMLLPLVLSVIFSCCAISLAEGGTATVTIDAARQGQRWEGWGATDMFSLSGLEVEGEAGNPGRIPVGGRKEILRLYYQDLGMTRVRIWPMGYEPEIGKFVWEGRGTRPVASLNPFCEDHLVLGREFRDSKEGFVMYPAAHQWESWMAAKPESKLWSWGEDAVFNPAMVEAYARHAAAGVTHVKEVCGYEIPYWSLFNEPSNTAAPTKETTLALVLACGREFARRGLATRLVICDDVTPEASADAIEYVLANEEAVRYVGAVSYHRYRGDFVLERVKPMLAKVGRGELLVSAPVSFYQSARTHGKSVWLSEQCSYGDDGITLHDTGRARANHICDEINYGGVNAFDFMLAYFPERGKPGNEETPIFLRFEQGQFRRAEVNPFGAWISHFTRFIRPGAVRLEAKVDDSRVKAVAFRDRAAQQLVLVVINNHPEQVEVSVTLHGASASGAAARIRTSAAKEREPLRTLPLGAGHLRDALPPLSVTTYTLTEG